MINPHDTELNQVATMSAQDRWGKEQPKYDIVKFSMIVNAHAHAFWMGAKHARKRPGQSLLSRVVRKIKPEDAPMACDFYIKKTYPSISHEDRALIVGVFEPAFELGFHYGEERVKQG